MKKLWEIQFEAARNKELSANAFRLLYLICSRWPRTCVSEPFKLSGRMAAEWLGLSRESENQGWKVIKELTGAGILVKRGVAGSPPTALFLVFNGGVFTAIDGCKNTANNGGKKAANHISNPFGNKYNPNGRNSSSLRSTETSGGEVKAAAPLVKATDAQLRQAADDFAKLKKSLNNS